MEQKYLNVRDYFRGQLWAIRPEALSVMEDVIRLRANGVSFTTEEINERIGAAQRRSIEASQRIAAAVRGTVATAGQIAVIPIYGVIDQKVSVMQQVSGGTAVDEIMSAFRAAISDEAVSAILFDIDSPGGSISGIQEAATEIYNARGTKPVIAVADPMIASAAYWLACAADEIYCMPSGSVGSIGVIAMHEDISAMNEQAGYKATYITYGQYKAEGNPDAPLSADALAYRQSQVDAIGNMFTQFVARGRNIPVATVRADFGQGRMLLAKDAMAVGMINGIATLDQVVSKLIKGQTSKSKTMSAENATPEIEDIIPPVKLMDSAKHATTAMQSVAKQFAERKEKRIAEKAMTPDKALTEKNKEAIQSARAAISDVRASLEDADSSLCALVEPIAHTITVQEQTADAGLLELERSRLMLALTLTQRI